MDTLHTFGFDPATADPTGFVLIWIPLVFHILILLIPGTIAYFTWKRQKEPQIVKHVRTDETDLTPGERAFIEKEEREHPAA